jgi:hypothetical protein
VGRLAEECKISINSTVAAGASGTADIDGTAVDMAGFEGVLYIVPVGAVAAGAVTTIKVQQCDTSGGVYADLDGPDVSIADDDDNKCKYVDVFRPREQYVKCIVERDGSNAATLGGIIAVQYGSRRTPVTHGTNVAGEMHSSVAEG